MIQILRQDGLLVLLGGRVIEPVPLEDEAEAKELLQGGGAQGTGQVVVVALLARVRLVQEGAQLGGILLVRLRVPLVDEVRRDPGGKHPRLHRHLEQDVESGDREPFGGVCTWKDGVRVWGWGSVVGIQSWAGVVGPR